MYHQYVRRHWYSLLLVIRVGHLLLHFLDGEESLGGHGGVEPNRKLRVGRQRHEFFDTQTSNLAGCVAQTLQEVSKIIYASQQQNYYFCVHTVMHNYSSVMHQRYATNEFCLFDL